MGTSKTFLLLAAAFTLVLLISSEVSARELADTTQIQEDADADHFYGHEHGHGYKHHKGGYGHGHGHGYGHGHRGKPGHGGHPPGHGAQEAETEAGN